MSKLIYKSDGGYEIELDISSVMRRAIHDNDPDELDRSLYEMKSLIVENTVGLRQPFKLPALRLPKFARRFF